MISFPIIDVSTLPPNTEPCPKGTTQVSFDPKTQKQFQITPYVPNICYDAVAAAPTGGFFCSTPSTPPGSDGSCPVELVKSATSVASYACGSPFENYHPKVKEAEAALSKAMAFYFKISGQNVQPEFQLCNPGYVVGKIWKNIATGTFKSGYSCHDAYFDPNFDTIPDNLCAPGATVLESNQFMGGVCCLKK